MAGDADTEGKVAADATKASEAFEKSLVCFSRLCNENHGCAF